IPTYISESQSNLTKMPDLELAGLLLLVVQSEYKKVHTKFISTGFGLTDEDQKVGIIKNNEKLEIMCPHYHAMNELMGDQAFPAGNEIISSYMESNNDSA
ncbi:hypothetical protein VP01_8965g1, partial [Puccinia sorghi]